MNKNSWEYWPRPLSVSQCEEEVRKIKARQQYSPPPNWTSIFAPIIFFGIMVAAPVAWVIALIADYITMRRNEPPYTLEVTLRLMTKPD